MPPLNWIQILLFLSIGAFLLPALAGGRARAIAGMVIAGIAVGGLIVLGILQTVIGARYTVHTIVDHQPLVHHQAAGWDADCAGRRVAFKPVVQRETERPQAETSVRPGLDPVQFEHERAEIERLWYDAELERRLWHVGSLAGGLLAWLAVATAYLKLDLLSSGRYRSRLRVAAASAVVAATAAAAWAWTQPL